MKTRLFLIAALLLLMLGAPPRGRVESCAFPMYEDSRDVFFYFFDPGLARDARLRPLSFAGLPAVTPSWDSAGDARQDNLAAWAEHLKGRFTTEEIEKIVYASPLAGLQAVTVKALARTAPAVVQRFAAARENLDYLIFAKRCEPLVAPPAGRDPWDDEDWRDLPAMAALLAEGKKRRQPAASPFIRDRYAFQIIRLAHYSGAHEQAVALCDEYFPGQANRGMIYYWSLALKAGALRRLGRTAEAAYLFSQVFERCRSKRFEAYHGFRIDSDGAYRDCLELCRDARERSVVLFLHGLDFDNSALEEMAAIHRELPDSPHLEVLLAREIARIERKLHGAAFNERAPRWDWPQLRDPDDVFHANLERLESFLQQAVAANRVQRLDFWKLALGYVRYLGGQLPLARGGLLALRDGKAEPAVKQQAETFLWLADIAALRMVDRESEARLFREYLRLRRHFPRYAPGVLHASYAAPAPPEGSGEAAAAGEPDAGDPKLRFLRSALMRLYEKQGDDVRAFLASEFHPAGPEPPQLYVRLENGPWLLQDIKAQRELVDRLIAFAGRQDRNEFEDYLLKAKYSSCCPPAGIARLLAEQKGTLLMRRCLWAEAAQALERAVDKNAGPVLLPDPFREHPLHPWGGGDEERLPLGKLEFARAMAQRTRNADAKADADAYYRLGCALHNISYFGPSWELLAFGRSPSGDGDPGTTAFLLQEAARRFAQAERAAKDGELAARACFRQADIALKLHAVSADFAKALQAQPWGASSGHYFNDYYGRELLVLRAFANPHFPRLKRQYAGTAYYRQIVKECKLFELYASRK